MNDPKKDKTQQTVTATATWPLFAGGSNIFNLCVALGIPLFFFTLSYGPIELTPQIISLVSNLSWWFVGLTVFSIFLYTRDGGVNKNQALVFGVALSIFSVIALDFFANRILSLIHI